MAFLKGSRFNDVADSTPPPGAYNPKFLTDMSISSQLHGTTFSKEHLTVTSRPSSHGSDQRYQRSSSFTRSRTSSSSRTAPIPARRNTSQPPLGRTRPSDSKATTTDSATLLKASLSDKGCNIEVPPEDPKIALLTQDNTQLRQKLTQLEKNHEEKVRTFEENKVREVEEEGAFHDNLVQLLQSQEEKHDSAKKIWAETEKSLTTTIETLQTSADEMHDLVEVTQGSYKAAMVKNDSLQRQIKEMEVEKSSLLERIKDLEKALHAQQGLVTDSEQRCLLLVENVEKSYQICEERVAAADAEKEEWTIKEQDLLATIKFFEGQVEELQIALEAEKSLESCEEKELKQQLTSMSPRSWADDSISALKTQWAQKEKHYLQIITQLKGQREDFLNEASGLIQDLVSSRENNDKLKERIQRLDPSAQTVTLAEGESCGAISSLESLDNNGNYVNNDSGLCDVTLPELSVLSDEENDFKLQNTSGILDNPPFESLQLEDYKQKTKNLMKVEKEIAKRCAENDSKMQNTLDLISKVEKDNKRKRHFISKLGLGETDESEPAIGRVKAKETASVMVGSTAEEKEEDEMILLYNGKLKNTKSDLIKQEVSRFGATLLEPHPNNRISPTKSPRTSSNIPVSGPGRMKNVESRGLCFNICSPLTSIPEDDENTNDVQ